MAPGLHPDQPSTVSLRLIVVLAGLALIIQVGFDVLLVGSTLPPRVDDGRDLLAFVTAGRIAADESLGPGDVYDPELQRRVQEEITGRTIPPGTGLPFIHPPHLLPIQRALAPLDYTTFWLCWSSIMLCLFLVGGAILDRSFRRAGVPPPTRLAFAAVGLAFGPVVISLLQGQDTALLYLGVAGWIAAFAARKDFLAGLALSLATIRPHIALVLAFPFLFARRRVLVGFVAGSVLLISFLVAEIGIAALVDFGRMVVAVAGGSEFAVDARPMVSLIGALRRISPESGHAFVRVLAWGVWLGMIAGLCVLWVRRGRSGGPAPAELGLAVVLSLALAPHLNYHDLSLIHAAMAPALVAQAGSDRGANGWLVIVALLGISLAISLATLSGFLVRDLLIASGFGVALLVLVRSRPGEMGENDIPARSGSPD